MGKRNGIFCTLAGKELDMNEDQEIKKIRRELTELSHDYYSSQVSLYIKGVIIAGVFLLGLIAGFLL